MKAKPVVIKILTAIRPALKKLLFCALFLVGNTLHAQTLYVDDVVHVLLRAEPSSESEILQRAIRSGTRLTQVQEETENNYFKVKLQENDLEGWIHSQYLVAQPIAREKLREATVRLENAETSLQEVSASHDQLIEENTTLTSLNATLTEQEHNLLIELEEIKTITAKTREINELNLKLSAQVEQFQQQLTILQAENKVLSDDTRIQWFIYGGGAIGSGILLGVLLPLMRLRRKRSEWF